MRKQDLRQPVNWRKRVTEASKREFWIYSSSYIEERVFMDARNE